MPRDNERTPHPVRTTLFCTKSERFNPLTKSFIPYNYSRVTDNNRSSRTRSIPFKTTTRSTRPPHPVHPEHPPQPTPPSALHDQGNVSLSPETLATLQRALDGGIARSTARKYDEAAHDFLSFCDTESIPAAQRLPASELLLCAFAARNVGVQAESTIRNSLLGVRSWHIQNGAEWNGGLRLARVLRAARLLAPQSSKRPLRAPATAKLLAEVVVGLDLSDPFDAAVAAIATTALWGMTRLGELLPDTKFPRDTTNFPSRRDLANLSPSRKSRSLRLPYTKTTQVDGATIIITNQSGLTNPLPLLENHLTVNAPDPEDLLFTFRTGQGQRAFISKKMFLQRCLAVLGKGFKGKLTGHCFRIGGTYELLRAGIPPEIVQKMGRWKSDAFLRYWRDEQFLSEIHITNAQLPHRSRNQS